MSDVQLDTERLAAVQTADAARRRAPIAVCGTRTPDEAQSAAAYAVGHRLAGMGAAVLCGGRGGVMAEVCRGVADAGGLSIGLLPDEEVDAANPYVTVALATGIGVARNAIIARAGAGMIAIGGGHGTLSEIAFALQFGRPVFTLADAPDVPGAVVCTDPEDAVARLLEALAGYQP